MPGFRAAEPPEPTRGAPVLLATHARASLPAPPRWKLLSSAEGELRLTSSGLLWRRSWFNVPWVGPSSFEIPLASVERAFVKGWALVVTTKEAEYGFYVGTGPVPQLYLFPARTARKWETAIAEAKKVLPS
jgi:hypothetical protein